MEYARRHFGTKHLLLLELQTRLWNQAPTFVWYANKKKTLEDQAKHLLLLGMQKNTWKPSTCFLLGMQKNTWKPSTYFLLGMQKNTWKPSTYFLLGMQKQHHTLKIQHLTSVGYAKTTLENQALTSVGYAKKKKQLKIKHLLLLLGMPETPEIHNNLRQIGLPILATITQTNNHSTLIENKILFPSAAPYLRYAWSKLFLSFSPKGGKWLWWCTLYPHDRNTKERNPGRESTAFPGETMSNLFRFPESEDTQNLKRNYFLINKM